MLSNVRVWINETWEVLLILRFFDFQQITSYLSSAILFINNMYHFPSVSNRFLESSCIMCSFSSFSSFPAPFYKHKANICILDSESSHTICAISSECWAHYLGFSIWNVAFLMFTWSLYGLASTNIGSHTRVWIPTPNICEQK